VQQLLRVALVDVDVPEAGGAEEAAVGDGARGDVDRDRHERGAQRRSHVTEAAVEAEEAARPAAAEGGAGPAVRGPRGPAVGGGGGVGAAVGRCGVDGAVSGVGGVYV